MPAVKPDEGGQNQAVAADQSQGYQPRKGQNTENMMEISRNHRFCSHGLGSQSRSPAELSDKKIGRIAPFY